MMGTHYVGTVEMYLEQCYKCGMSFAMPQNYNDARRTDHKTFYCPSGHGQAYLCESREDRLARELRHAEECKSRCMSGMEKQKHQIRALRGVITKKKKQLGEVDGNGEG